MAAAARCGRNLRTIAIRLCGAPPESIATASCPFGAWTVGTSKVWRWSVPLRPELARATKHRHPRFAKTCMYDRLKFVELPSPINRKGDTHETLDFSNCERGPACRVRHEARKL